MAVDQLRCILLWDKSRRGGFRISSPFTARTTRKSVTPNTLHLILHATTFVTLILLVFAR